MSKNEERNKEAESPSHLAGRRTEMKVSFYSVYFPAGCSIHLHRITGLFGWEGPLETS